MNKVLLGLFFCSLFLLAGCVQKQAASEQSIQDIVSQAKDYGDIAKEQPKEENITVINQTTINETKEEEPKISETFVINKKCRYSAILYDGCKWKDKEETNFDLKILSSGKNPIPGVWFIITGESGGVKQVRKEGEILVGGTKVYNIDYTALVKELGVVKKFEVYPIQVTDNQEEACENQRVYTIPKAYCKPFIVPRVNEDGSINETS